MRRYYFELLDENYNDLGAFIPDGSSKQAAVNKAKKWMRERDKVCAAISKQHDNRQPVTVYRHRN